MSRGRGKYSKFRQPLAPSGSISAPPATHNSPSPELPRRRNSGQPQRLRRQKSHPGPLLLSGHLNRSPGLDFQNTYPSPNRHEMPPRSPSHPTPPGSHPQPPNSSPPPPSRLSLSPEPFENLALQVAGLADGDLFARGDLVQGITEEIAERDPVSLVGTICPQPAECQFRFLAGPLTGKCLQPYLGAPPPVDRDRTARWPPIGPASVQDEWDTPLCITFPKAGESHRG